MAIPTPEAGLVISYAYLWHHEHTAGQEEGRKDRPSVIVLTVVAESDSRTIVTVLPVTHSAPTDPAGAVDIPAAIKRHLGLDNYRSWIVVAEGNKFVWPGYDLRKAPNADRYDYGFLPPGFFNRVLEAFVAWNHTHKHRLLRADSKRATTERPVPHVGVANFLSGAKATIAVPVAGCGRSV